MAGIAELRFAGASDLVSVMLPAKIALDASHEVIVGREVPAGVVLDSPAQSLMISRCHTRISYTSDRCWKLEDLQSTNGTQLNGVKVSQAVLADGDVITFGGAKSTALNKRPGPKAVKSIYTYSFHSLQAHAQDLDDSVATCESPVLLVTTQSKSAAPATAPRPSKGKEPAEAETQQATATSREGTAEKNISGTKRKASTSGGESSTDKQRKLESPAHPRALAKINHAQITIPKVSKALKMGQIEEQGESQCSPDTSAMRQRTSPAMAASSTPKLTKGDEEQEDEHSGVGSSVRRTPRVRQQVKPYGKGEGKEPVQRAKRGGGKDAVPMRGRGGAGGRAKSGERGAGGSSKSGRDAPRKESTVPVAPVRGSGKSMPGSKAKKGRKRANISDESNNCEEQRVGEAGASGGGPSATAPGCCETCGKVKRGKKAERCECEECEECNTRWDEDKVDLTWCSRCAGCTARRKASGQKNKARKAERIGGCCECVACPGCGVLYPTKLSPAIRWEGSLWENNVRCDCWGSAQSKCSGCVCNDCCYANAGSIAGSIGSRESFDD